MARTRFMPDTGLTVRMTTVLFLLGGLFVAGCIFLIFLALLLGRRLVTAVVCFLLLLLVLAFLLHGCLGGLF